MPDSSNKNQIPTTVESVIKTYSLIHRYFFTYAIFVIALIIGAIIFQNILKTNALTVQSSEVNHEFIIKQKELIGAFNKQLKQNIENAGVEVQIIQGHINSTGEYIESSNNLAMYKGYVLPRFFYIYKTFPLQNISYFAQSGYDTKELDYFIKNVLLAKVEINQKQEANLQLPIKGTVMETFELGCMFKSKFYQAICDQRIKEFLDSFFVYNIHRDYDGFKTIFDTIISDSEYKEVLCENIDKYIIYSNDTSTTIEELVKKCDSESVEKFKKLASFIEIQKQLDSKQVSKSVYNDSDINAYKLVSLQQTIYKDIVNKRVNTSSITQYLNFLKELLAINKIDAFYKDLSYRFNNKYVLPRIENPNNPITKNRKSDADEIIKQITIVNNGSELLGFKGLIYQIRNTALLPLQVKSETQTTSIQEKINILLGSMSYLRIREKIFSGDDILINGDFIIDDIQEVGKKLKLNTALLLQYQQNEFVVKKIKIENQNILNAVMKEILTKAEYSLSEMREYINQNYAFYNQASQTNTTNIMCDQIKNKITVNPNIQVKECTTSKLSVTKSVEEIIISYNIAFANYTITDITISDQAIEAAIKEKLTNISTNEVNFVDVISSIIYYEIPQTSTTQGADNTIIITEKIKNYLGININDIAERSGKILIEFSVGRIKFIGNYNITKHVIYPIYFKEVLLNNVPAKIMNFSLSLDDASKTDIYKFISNPAEYIKTISPESYLLYDKFISGE